MRIFIPRELKPQESRVALVPEDVARLLREGNEVFIQKGAGTNAGFDDQHYQQAASSVSRGQLLHTLTNAERGFQQAELVVKVKEPQAEELALLRQGQVLFSYLHLAAARELTRGLLQRGVSALSFETFKDSRGRYPLLEPMSRIAGRLSVQLAAQLLQKHHQGRGILLSSVGNVPGARVLVVGGGIVGQEAALLGLALGAKVILLEKSKKKLASLQVALSASLSRGLEIVESTVDCFDEALPLADVIIFAVLRPGLRPPVLLKRVDLKRMKSGAVIVDVAIDQGGCCETSRPTTHDCPSYVEQGIVHCCVANLPGAVPRTSSRVLSSAIIESVSLLAREGVSTFSSAGSPLRSALNLMGGKIIHPAISQSFPKL